MFLSHSIQWLSHFLPSVIITHSASRPINPLLDDGTHLPLSPVPPPALVPWTHAEWDPHSRSWPWPTDICPPVGFPRPQTAGGSPAVDPSAVCVLHCHRPSWDAQCCLEREAPRQKCTKHSQGDRTGQQGVCVRACACVCVCVCASVYA